MSRPIVIVDPGRLPWTVDQMEQAILPGSTWGLYEFSNMLVRVVQAEPDQDKKIRRPADALVLRRATIPMLQDICGRAIAWQNTKGEDVDCPARVAAIYLSREGLRRLPALQGIINAPIIRPDGSVLTEPGYDEATGLLLHSPVAWRAPRELSKETIDAAVETLKAPFAEFPIAPEGLSVVISAIMTALQRRLLFSAPADAFDAPAQGSGKSLIADCVCIIATGHEAVSTTVNADGDELSKKLFSVLRSGDLIFELDNITVPLRCDALASILTQPTFQDRILGVSEMSRALPTNLLFLLTGNNLSFSGDMPSRVIVARIEPDCEKPEQRTFKIRALRAHVHEHRVELIQAALTILKAYYAAGRPDQGLKPFGRFEQWSNEIRNALVWVGLPDPCATREAIDAADPERDSMLALYTQWERTATIPVTLAKLIEIAETDEDLKSAMLSVAADIDHPGKVSARRLGAWCRSRKGRIVGDFRLREEGHAHGGLKMYRVVKIETSVTKEI